MSTTTHDVVDGLLDLEEGDRVRLKAQYYEWGSPFEVGSIEEQPWTAPDDSVWIAKHIELESTSPAGSDREFDVYPAASPPYMGSGYGVLTSVEVLGEDDDADANERCHWLDRPADEIVAVSPVNRTLEEVLTDVDHQDDILDVRGRLGVDLPKVKNLLWELGLRGEDGRLLDDDILEVRIGEMREVFVDE